MNSKNILFSKMNIGSLELKNRFIVPSMVTNYCNVDGTSTDQLIAYHETKARGGWGLIITEAFKITPNCGGYSNMGGLWADYQIESHKKLTDAVHRAGSKIVVQLIHGGRQVAESASGVIPVAPSAIKDPTIPDIPHELSISEIQELVQSFTDAAERAKLAGFDGVEIHGAHGYLLNEFLSPFSNKRTDEYGGSTIGRTKIIVEIVHSIRNRLGKDFPVILRLSVDEYVTGGLSLQESSIISKIAQDAGYDAIHCAQGIYKSAHVIISPSVVPSGAYQDNAGAIKKEVDIPVIAVGRINTPEIAEHIVLSGKADFVAMGRASLADPYLPVKLKEQRRDEIQQCIGCVQGCIGEIERGNTVRCLVNPKTGKETEYLSPKDYSGQKALVVGGGICGCQAALNLARAGAQVSLYEASDRLGGQWNAASIPLGKTEFTTLIIWLKEQLKQFEVQINLNFEVNEAMIFAEKPDILIIATGSKPNKPNIEGLDETVCEANDVLMGKCTLGEKVAVLGGGLVGAETAEHLSSHGHQVTIIEMAAQIAKDGEPAANYFLMKNLKDNNVTIYTNAIVQSLTKNSVTFLKDNKMETIHIDSIVKATGNCSYQPFSDELLKQLPKTIVLGDALKTKNALYNLQESFELTWN